MAKNNEAKIKFTASTAEFNDAIKKAESAMTELRAELKLNAAQMESTGDVIGGLNRKHEILSKQLKESKDKTQALEGKLEAARRCFGENSNEVSKLKTQLTNAKTAQTKLETAVKNCTNEIEEATRETGDLEKSLDNASDDAKDFKKNIEDAGDAAEDSADGYTVLKDVISDLVTDAIQWGIDKFGELMLAADSALSDLGARTGATTTELEGFEDVMDSIYRNNYGESYEDISDAMSTVIQTLGDLDDASLQGVTENAIALRDTFDMDYNESLRAVNSLMDQFGISADEAFNLIAQGAQNGLNQNDDLLDTINEYSVQFSTAGYSADEMFNMLKNGVDAGTWSVDKLGDAVKEFNIRAKDGTVADGLEEYRKSLGLSEKDVKRLSEQMKKGGEDGQKAFGEIIAAVMNVDDETTRYQAGVALFGTMWEDLGEDTIKALMNTNGELKASKDAMTDLKNMKYDNLGSALQGLGRVIETDLIKPIVDVLAPIAKDIVEWCIEHIDVLGPIIMGVATALGVLAAALAIQTLISGVTKAFSMLNITMLSNPIVLIVALIAGLVVAFIALWNNCEGFREFWIGLWENVKAVFNSLVEWMMPYITMLWEYIKTAWEGIKTAVTDAVNAIWPIVLVVWESIKNIVSTVMGAIISIITVVWTAISSYFTTTFETLKTIFSAAWDWIKALVTGDTEGIQTSLTTIWEAIKGYFSSVFEILKTLFSEAWEIIKTTTSTVFETIKTTLSTIWDSIKEKVMGAIDNLKAFIPEAWESIKTATANIFEGLKTTAITIWEGLKSSVSGIVNGAKTAVMTAWNGIKTATSNVFNNVKNTATILWETLKTSLSGIVEGVKTTITGAWDTIKNKTGSVFINIKSTATRLWNSIKLAITKPIEAAKTKVKSVIDAIKGFFDFEFTWPHIPMPHFGISPAGWKVGDLLQGSIPTLSVQWYAEGGIMTKPTAFGINGNSLMVGGEAGPEAILPIDRLEGYISDAIERKMGNLNLEALASSIEDLASRPIALNINGRQFALATAGDGDSVNGLRTTFKSRGLALD